MTDEETEAARTTCEKEQRKRPTVKWGRPAWGWGREREREREERLRRMFGPEQTLWAIETEEKEEEERCVRVKSCSSMSRRGKGDCGLWIGSAVEPT